VLDGNILGVGGWVGLGGERVYHLARKEIESYDLLALLGRAIAKGIASGEVDTWGACGCVYVRACTSPRKGPLEDSVSSGSSDLVAATLHTLCPSAYTHAPLFVVSVSLYCIIIGLVMSHILVLPSLVCILNANAPPRNPSPPWPLPTARYPRAQPRAVVHVRGASSLPAG
jgi:hypothetical protein